MCVPVMERYKLKVSTWMVPPSMSKLIPSFRPPFDIIF